MKLNKSSVTLVVQALMTLILICTIVFLIITHQEIPDLLAQITFALMGFWFGTQGRVEVSETIRQINSLQVHNRGPPLE